MTRRLPPQPNHSRLARLVGRLVFFARRNMRFVRRGTYDDLNSRHVGLQGAYTSLSKNHRELMDDYGKFLPSFTPRVDRVSFRRHQGPFDRDPVHVLSVSFRPLNIATTCVPVRREELSAYTVHVLERQARAIARDHEDEVVRAIVSAAAPQAKAMNKDRRLG